MPADEAEVLVRQRNKTRNKKILYMLQDGTFRVMRYLFNTLNRYLLRNVGLQLEPDV